MFTTSWLTRLKSSLTRTSLNRQRGGRRSQNSVAPASAETLELRQLMTATNGSVSTDGDSVQQELYVSTETAGRLTNPDGSVVQFDDSDILKFVQQADGRWGARLSFDGSDVGLTTDAEDIDAIALLSDGSWLISTVGNVSVPGVASAGREDLLRFVPQSLGENTIGTWSLYFDGSDVGLSTSTENIDSIDVLSDGSLLISTTGNVSVPGVANGVSHDVLRFQVVALGNNTSGTWSMYFDGSDVGLTTSSENIDNIAGDGQSLMTTGAFTVPNLTGTGSDISYFATSQTGDNTAGNFESDFLDSSWNRSKLNVDALEIVEIDVAPTPTPVPPPTPTSPPVPQDDWTNEIGPQAGAITIGSNGTAVATGTIERTGDVDTFQFNITAAGQLNLAAVANTPGFNTLIKLFDSTGRRLTSVGYDVANQSVSQSVALGLYYVQVSGFTSTDVGSYTMNLSFVSDDHVNQISPQATNVVLDADGIGRATGSIEQAGDIDTFQVTAPTAGQLSMTVSGNQLGRDTGIMIFNAEGHQQPTATMFAADNNSATTTSLSLTAGTYFVSIRRVGNATGAYTLEARLIRPTPPPIVDDHVNAAGSQATTILLVNGGSGNASGNLERVGDVDVFQVTVGASGQLTVNVVASQSTLNPNVEIRDSSGRLLTGNDDSPFGDTKNSSITFVSDPGVYFVLVSAFNNATSGEYAVDVRWVDNTTEGRGGTSGGGNRSNQFNIDLVFADDGVNNGIQQAMRQAANRWSQIIVSDLPNVVHLYSGGNVVIDDLVIQVRTESLDGAGNDLAGGKPIRLRSGGGLPYSGIITFDRADIGSLSWNNHLYTTALHEIGHVLGIGNLWQQRGLVRQSGTDYAYIGSNAVSQMNAIFGTRLGYVPVEGGTDDGSSGLHWSENAFRSELMTPVSGLGSMPLSRITVGALADLGYTVNYAAADYYSGSTSGFGSRITTFGPTQIGLGSSTSAFNLPQEFLLAQPPLNSILPSSLSDDYGLSMTQLPESDPNFGHRVQLADGRQVDAIAPHLFGEIDQLMSNSLQTFALL